MRTTNKTGEKKEGKKKEKGKKKHKSLSLPPPAPQTHQSARLQRASTWTWFPELYSPLYPSSGLV
jgi:hypothetical protein